MDTMKTIYATDNSLSRSKSKEFFGVVITDKKGKPCEGIHKIKLDGKKVKVRFHKGLIDGNIYSPDGTIIKREPAIEYYSKGGTEYWTRGYPEGEPAIVQEIGYYEEWWSNGKLVVIRNNLEFIGLE